MDGARVARRGIVRRVESGHREAVGRTRGGRAGIARDGEVCRSARGDRDRRLRAVDGAGDRVRRRDGLLADDPQDDARERVVARVTTGERVVAWQGRRPSVLVKWTVPVYPVAMLLSASRAVTVTLWEAPETVGSLKPVTVKCVAAEAMTLIFDWCR